MRTLLLVLALAAACSGERALAPVEAPAFLLGDTPTNSLLGETPTITYSPADGGFTVRIELNRGLFNATHRGNASFALRTTLSVDNAGGQVGFLEQDNLLSELKLADPRPDPFILVEYFVAWDGKDGEGDQVTGTVTVSYGIGVVPMGAVFEPNDAGFLGGGPVSGFFDITLTDPVGNLP